MLRPNSRGLLSSSAKPRLAIIVRGMAMMANSERDDERLDDIRVRGHPDVVVEADEADGVGMDQVEVGQRQDQRCDQRPGREQDEPDDPRPDEDDAPDRLAPDGSSTAGLAGSARRTGRRVTWWLSITSLNGSISIWRSPRAGGASRAEGCSPARATSRRRCPGGSSSTWPARRQCRRRRWSGRRSGRPARRTWHLRVIRDPGLMVGDVREGEHRLRHVPVELDARELGIDRP